MRSELLPFYGVEGLIPPPDGLTSPPLGPIISGHPRGCHGHRAHNRVYNLSNLPCGLWRII